MLLYKTLQNAPEELKSVTKEGYMPRSKLLQFMALSENYMLKGLQKSTIMPKDTRMLDFSL